MFWNNCSMPSVFSQSRGLLVLAESCHTDVIRDVNKSHADELGATDLEVIVVFCYRRCLWVGHGS